MASDNSSDELSKYVRRAVGTKISNGKNNKSFKLLYCASIDSNVPDVEKFHLQCDSKKPTLTVLHGKHNTVFGGFTSAEWSSSKHYSKKDTQAFLFSMNDNEGAECKFFPVKDNKTDIAITCDANFGPTFGAKSLRNHYDLQVFKKDSKPESKQKGNFLQLNGVFDIGNAYNTNEADGGKVKSKDINSGMLIVKKIEVFHVIDDEYPEPWRTKPEDEHVEEIKKQLKMKEPIRGLGIKKYNVLLIGTVGVGKSSFYNTLATVFRDKVETFAPTGGSKGSVTNEIKAYTIEYEKDAELCVRIFDIRGFESQRGYEHELALILNGQLPIGYQFPDKMSEPAEEDICKTTTLDDQIHLLCFLTGPPENYNTAQIEEIDNILHITNVKGLPKVVVATKFDEQCLNITEDVDHLYKCKKSKETTEDISKFFKIQENHVLPVVNYTSETIKSKGKERLALQALHKMIEVTEGFLSKHADKETKLDAFEKRKQRLLKQQEIDVEVRRLGEEMTRSETETFRILCIGPMHSGKSCFIDSMSSALLRKITHKVEGNGACGGRGDCPNTEMFQLYKVGDKRSKVYFGDMPGFEKAGGITKEDILSIVEGNVPKKFNSKDATSKVQLGKVDKIHCVSVVFDCKTVDAGLPTEVKTTINTVLKVLSKKDIPYIVILTKGDELSGNIQFDKLLVYESKHVKRCVRALQTEFKFRQNVIFPVINYTDESNVDDAGDILLLDALSEILKLARNDLEGNDEKASNYESDQ